MSVMQQRFLSIGEIGVRLHVMEARIRRFLSVPRPYLVRVGRARGVSEEALPQLVADLIPLLRAGELLDGWSERWAVLERDRYRDMRMAARDVLGRGTEKGQEKQVANYACGSMRSVHTLHSVAKTNNDSREP